MECPFCVEADIIRTDRIVQMVAILRSSIICFLILHTIFTNRERRLAI